jgi:hypothetical protein
MPIIISVAMLLIALGDLPYGYYTLLRFVVCGTATFVVVVSYPGDKIWIAWLFGFVAILFNPFVKIHFNKDIWQFLDVITAMVFIAGIFMINLARK